MNRIQRLRKKAGLVPTDKVEYLCQLTEDPNNEIATVFEAQKEFLNQQLKQDVIHLKTAPEGKIIAYEEHEVFPIS